MVYLLGPRYSKFSVKLFKLLVLYFSWLMHVPFASSHTSSISSICETKLVCFGQVFTNTSKPCNGCENAFLLLMKQKFVVVQTALDWLYIYPKGIHHLMLHIRDQYKNPEIYITENGNRFYWGALQWSYHIIYQVTSSLNLRICFFRSWSSFFVHDSWCNTNRLCEA